MPGDRVKALRESRAPTLDLRRPRAFGWECGSHEKNLALIIVIREPGHELFLSYSIYLSVSSAGQGIRAAPLSNRERGDEADA